MRKILNLILVLLIFPSLIFSRNDVFTHPKTADANNRYKKYLPVGISEINIEFGGYGGGIYGLSPENLLKYLVRFKFIEDIFKSKGVPYDFDHLNKLVPGIYGVISKAWRDAWRTLENNCQAFKDAHGGQALSEFKELLRKYENPFEFTNDFRTFDSYARTAHPPDPKKHDLKWMQWPHDRLETIIRFLLDNNYQIKNYKDYVDPVNKNKMVDFYNYIAHEMMHMFTDILDDLNPNNNSVTPDDCEINCILKSCGFSVEVNSKCNKLCFDGYCKNNKYEPCKPKKKKDGDRGDEPDDNYSYAGASGDALFSEGLDSMFGFSGLLSNTPGDFVCSYYPDVLIYNKFEFDEMEKLLNRSEADNFIDDYEFTDFSNNHKVLVVPSGELMGEKDSELIKQAFKRFVESGGTLLVLNQQYGEDIDQLVPVPDGESLHSYGWREDQSCYWGSSYFKGMHPVLSSFNAEKVSAAVDGYFSIYPSNSTILLRRISNQEPCLLYYPYGQGTVILTSLYTDWGLAHSQATIDELRMVRDLITFARTPKLPIPMFDLKANATPTIDLAATIKNSTETAAAKIKIRVSTPDRARVLFETETALALAGGAETTLPINFSLPALERKDYGICHTDYELYDAEGNLVQMATESDSGRLAAWKMMENGEEWLLPCAGGVSGKSEK